MSDSENHVYLNLEESAEECPDDVPYVTGNGANGYIVSDGMNGNDGANFDSDEADTDESDESEEGAMGGEIEENATTVFDKHSDTVYCVKVNPVNSENVATGGKDDLAYVWNTGSGEILHKTSSHEDTVTCVGYSFDGVYLATGDMSGFIEVINSSNWESVWTYKTDDIEWMKWHHSAHVLMTGNADGTIFVRNVPGDQCKVLTAGDVPVTTGLFLPDGTRACSGDINGVVKVWDIKTSTCLQTVHGDTAAVVCMDCHVDNVLLMAGLEDSKARLINSQNGKIIKTLECSSGQDVLDDAVEVVGFSPSLPLVATGTLVGSLSIWDIRSCVRREVCLHPKGVVKLVWEKEGQLFYTACLDGVLRLWDARNGQVVSSWKGHRDSIMDFDISRDGSLIVTTSRDNTARVFSTHQPQP